MSIDSLVVQCQCQLKWSIIVLNEWLGLQYRLQWPHLPTMTNDNDNDSGPSHELKAIWGNGLGLTSLLWKSPRIVVWHQQEQNRVKYSDQRKCRGILWVTAKSWKRDYVRWLSDLPLACKIKAVKFDNFTSQFWQHNPIPHHDNSDPPSPSNEHPFTTVFNEKHIWNLDR